jgi:hypothetical protein
MCGKSFKKVGHINCKFIAFEMKKRALLTSYKTELAIFESSWLKTLALHKVEVLVLC